MKILAPSLNCTEKDSYLGAGQVTVEDENRAAAALSREACTATGPALRGSRARGPCRGYYSAGSGHLAPGHAVQAADQLEAVGFVHAGDFRRGSGNGHGGAGRSEVTLVVFGSPRGGST